MDGVFASASTRDRGFVEETLIPLLLRHFLEPSWSPDDVATHEQWEEATADALAGSEWFLVVLSPDALQSEWVKAEVEWAVVHRKGKIVLVMCHDCDPAALHAALVDCQCIDFTGDVSEASRKLVRACGREFRPAGPSEIRLIVTHGDGVSGVQMKTFPVHDTTSVGRSRKSDILVSDPRVSRDHATIEVRPSGNRNGLWISDAGSTSGVIVNGERIEGPVELKAQDEIVLGDSRLVVQGIRVTNPDGSVSGELPGAGLRIAGAGAAEAFLPAPGSGAGAASSRMATLRAVAPEVPEASDPRMLLAEPSDDEKEALRELFAEWTDKRLFDAFQRKQCSEPVLKIIEEELTRRARPWGIGDR